MVFDLVLLLIMLGSVVLGLRKGFFITFVHTLGWFVSLTAGFFGTYFLKEPLMETPVFDLVKGGVLGAVDFETFDINTLENLSFAPSNIQYFLEQFVSTSFDKAVLGISELVFTVLLFLCLALLAKGILYLISRLIIGGHRKNALGFMDKLLGLTLGLVRGAIFVFILLALVVPALNLLDANSATLIMASLDNSFVAKDLFDNNYITLVLSNILD